MESRIPVPTDNIFKFYALFSLLVFVFSIGAVLYSNNAANRLVFSAVVEIETLKQDPVPSASQKMRIAALERQLDLSQSDRNFYTIALSFLVTFSIVGMFYGFKKWHMEVQPVIDESARIQLEIAKLQLEKMRAEVGKSDA
jgi:hypothetical protein